MKQKKPTNEELQKKIKNAIVIVPKDRETKSIFFSDKGIRYTVTDDYAVISTNFHSHVFDKVTSNGYSMPYLYTKQFVEMALENDCSVKLADGSIRYSYKKLFDVLKAKEDQNEYNIANYFDWWSFNIFAPLFSIDTNAAMQFTVYFNYMSNIATNRIILDEHKEGLTNIEFVKQHAKLMKEFVNGIGETQILEPESDEDKIKKEADAMKEQEQDESIKEQ